MTLIKAFLASTFLLLAAVSPQAAFAQQEATPSTQAEAVPAFDDRDTSHMVTLDWEVPIFQPSPEVRTSPAGLALQQGQRENMTDFELSRSVKTTQTEGSDLRSLDIRMAMSLEDFSKVPSRFVHQFWLVGPPDGGLSATITDAIWHVRQQDGTTTGSFTMAQDTEWGQLPRQMSSLTITEVDTFRTVALYRVDMLMITPINRVGATSAVDTAIMKSATFTTTLRPVPRGETINLSQEDPYTLDLVRQIVQNPSQVQVSARRPKALPNSAELGNWNSLLTRAGASNPIIFARVPRGGLYSLTATDLRNIGLVPENVQVDKLRFFCGKDELPFLRSGVRDNRLLGTSRLIFYIPEDPTDRKPFMPLWVIQDNDLAESRGIEAQPAEVPRATEVDHIGQREHWIFEPNVYSHTLQPSGPQMRWGTLEVRAESFSDQEFEIPGVADGRSTPFKVWASGSSPTGGAILRLYVNGTFLTEEQVRGNRIVEVIGEIPAGMLRSGTNRLSLENTNIENMAGMSVTFLAAELWQPTSTMNLPSNQSMTLLSDEPTTQPLPFKRMTESETMAWMVDITSPLAPSFHMMQRMGTLANPSYRMNASVKGPNSRIIWASEETLFSVPGMQVVEAPKVFLSTEQLDYLAITHPTLTKALEPLIEERSKSYKAEVLTVDEIYAAFSYGEQRFEAIHEALKHLFARRSGAKLSNVLLVGEGSEYWWEYRRPSTNVSKNMVPVYGWQNAQIDIRGDDSYALLTGNGPLADLEIGRISVNDSEELSKVVTKLISYETAAPRGDWMHRHLFVADDEPEFERVIDDVVRKAFTGKEYVVTLALQYFPYEDYFRGFWRKRSSALTDRLLAEWNSGARTITYLGHGGPNLWSSERILHNRDVEMINTGGRLPFLVAGSCDTGWVDFPIDPVKASLAEQLVRNPIGGAIAAFIPIDGTSSYEHNFLLTAFHDAMHQRGFRKVGTISLLSKINYHLNRNNFRVTNQYLLMGDPATVMPEAGTPLQISADRTYLLTDTGGSLNVEGSVEGMDWGLAHATLTTPTFKVMSEAKFIVQNGKFAGTMQLPLRVEEGDYELSVRVVNNQEGDLRTGMIPIPIERHRLSFQWASNVPAEPPPPAGTPIRLTARVYNKSLRDVDRTWLVLENPVDRSIYYSKAFSVKAESFEEVAIERELPPGISSVRARVYTQEPKADDSPALEPIAESEHILYTLQGEDRLLDVLRQHITVKRLPKNTGTEFAIPVFNLSGQQVENSLFRFTWKKSETESETIGTPVKLARLENGQRILIKFQTKEVFKPEMHTFGLIHYDGVTDEVRQADIVDLSLSIGPDLEIIAEDFVLENENPRAGNTVYAMVTVRNSGDTPMTQVKAQLYLAEPWVERNIAPNSVPWSAAKPLPVLMPGATATFRLRWDPFGAGAATHVLYATVSASESEANLQNNVVMRRVPLLAPSNLAVSPGGVKVTHDFARPYDRIGVTVPIVNDSEFDFMREFRVAAYASGPTVAKRRLLSRRFEFLLAGESADLQFEWLVQEGENTIEVDVNEDREYLETSYTDNRWVATLPMVFPSTWFGNPTVGWDFGEAEKFLSGTGFTLLPDGTHTVSRKPRDESYDVHYNPEYVIGGELAPSDVIDSLPGSHNGNQVRVHGSEIAPPLKFRLPMNPDDDTTYYEIVSVHLPRNPKAPDLSGVFRYRLENSTDWIVEDRPVGPELTLGRIDTKDDFLIYEFASTERAGYIHLLRLIARPIVAQIDSVIVQVSKMPRARLVAKVTTPEDSRVVFRVRYGLGTTENIVWRDWQVVENGSPLPPAPTGTLFFQWRARLVETPNGRPTLDNVSLEILPELPPTPAAKDVATRNRRK